MLALKHDHCQGVKKVAGVQVLCLENSAPAIPSFLWEWAAMTLGDSGKHRIVTFHLQRWVFLIKSKELKVALPHQKLNLLHKSKSKPDSIQKI